MKEILGGIAALFAFIVLALGISWICTGNDFFIYKFFAPRQEAVRREVYEESKAYNEGMAQELRNYQITYETTDNEHKEAIASMIRHQYAGYDTSRLPPDLRSFLSSLSTSPSSNFGGTR